MKQILVAVVVAASGLVGGPTETPVLANPGFESGTAAGWTTTGDQSASFVEAGGHGGSGFRLTHWAATGYSVRTEQRLTGLRNGRYTLKVWIRTDGGQDAADVALRDCGPAGRSERTALPRTGGTDWVQIVSSTMVTRHRCTASLSSVAQAGQWAHFDGVELVAAATVPVRIRGADVSTLKKNEDFGAVTTTRPAGPGTHWRS